MPGGGRAFGPKPHSFRTEMPRRQRRSALVSALSLRAGENAVSVIEGIVVDAAPKTARVAGVLAKIGLTGKKTLLVVGQQNDTVWKSVRNLRNVNTTLAHQLNAYDLLDCEQLLLTQEGLARVTEVFAK
jgi:large subunit ribosomal protein L4